MPNIALFPPEQTVGVFRGFTEGGLEFHADLVLPYRSDFQNIPMHGQFILVQLETPDEAVLGRISSFSSDGKLSTGIGEEFNIRALREGRPVPEDLREQYLKYKVNIRVLGVIRCGNGKGLTFVPSQRRLPHVGSPVAFLSDAVLKEVAGHNDEGVPIGFFALGEYVYSGENASFETLPWMQIREPEIQVKFSMDSLVSRRSFIFARAGFGKSNLNKLLFSRLYRTTPMVEKRGGKKVPVGTILFDPDGEYFWPDDKGRPGLCDVPELQDQLVVFTSRKAPSRFYDSFVAGDIKLDIRRMRPSDVISIALSPDRQEQQNVRKLKGLTQDKWEKMVDLIDQYGNEVPLKDMIALMSLEKSQEVEALAARGNMTTIVKMLHDKSSQLMDMLIHSLSEGKLCIIDSSKIRRGQSLILSGLILQRIFDRNQDEFTASEPRTIPTIAVIEEAQTVLNGSSVGSEPYIAWVKEGRKYDLGAVMITQQPGSIPNEILSQGDNWFIFHLLSSQDLKNVKYANAHFSDDLLSVLLNEPIQGQGVYWSSVKGKPYPLPVRIHLFEAEVKTLDPQYNCQPVPTYASRLKEKFQNELEGQPACEEDNEMRENKKDPHKIYLDRMVRLLRSDEERMEKIRNGLMPWGGLRAYFIEQLPDSIEDKETYAYNMVARVLNAIFGPQNHAWYSYRNENGVAYIAIGPRVY